MFESVLLLAASSHILQFRQDIVIFMGQFVPRVYGQCGFTLPINLQDDTDEEEKNTSKRKSMSSSLPKHCTEKTIRWNQILKKITSFLEY